MEKGHKLKFGAMAVKKDFVKNVLVHKIAKQLRNHNLVPIHDFDKDTSTTVTHDCAEHGKKIVFFCAQHDDVICFKCIQSCHVSCDVTELEEVAKGIKSSNALTDVHETIETILQNIKECNTVCNENEKSLVSDEARIKFQIREGRKKVNAVFDILEEKLTQKLDSQISLRQRQIQTFKSSLGLMEVKLKQFAKHMSTFTVSSEIQTFVGLRIVQKSLNKEETALKDLMPKIVPTKFNFSTNPKLQSFCNDFNSLGKIQTETNLKSLEYVDIKCRQAQQISSSTNETLCNYHFPASTNQVHSNDNVELLSNNDISKVRLCLRTQFQVQSNKSSSVLTSCLILPSKEMLFADALNKRLLIYDADGSFDHFIKLQDHPFDVALLKNKRVVVTYKFYHGPAHIDEVDIYSYKQSSFLVDEKVQAYLGISTSNENEVFVVAFPCGIQRIDTLTKKVTHVPIRPNNVFNIAIHDSKIYYTNKDKNILFCSNTSGQILWRFKDDKMRCPKPSSISISIDENGNVYVAGMVENIVMMVSKDGEKKKIVLDQSNKLEKPRCIYYDKCYKQLLVCNQDDGLASRYDVKW